MCNTPPPTRTLLLRLLLLLLLIVLLTTAVDTGARRVSVTPRDSKLGIRGDAEPRLRLTGFYAQGTGDSAVC